MTIEQKEKLMLADDLTDYINKKHTQEECTGFIDGYNAALAKLKLFTTPVVAGSLPTEEQIDDNVSRVTASTWSDYDAGYIDGTRDGAHWVIDFVNEKLSKLY